MLAAPAPAAPATIEGLQYAEGPVGTASASAHGKMPTAAVDCGRLAGRVFATLSTGERQRVQLARAVAQVMAVRDDAPTSRFLLLDEPTSSLDPAHQHSAMRLVRQIAGTGCGVLAVLHDLNLAAAYADRVVLMHEAQVIESGTPSEVLRADLLESVFDIPMLVIPHPQLSHPLVIAEPQPQA